MKYLRDFSHEKTKNKRNKHLKATYKMSWYFISRLMVYTERYKEAINHMCSLKSLIQYSEPHMAEHIFSMAADLQF